RRDAVEIGHLDIEHGNVGIDALELVDGVASGAQRSGYREIGLGLDPARDQPADDGGIVHHHDANRIVLLDRRASGRTYNDTHYSPTNATLLKSRLTRSLRSWHWPPTAVPASDQPDLMELRRDDVLVERLHDVLVGAGVERACDVRNVVLGGAEHHFRPVAVGQPAQHAQELVAVHLRHVPVEQHGVGHLTAAGVERLLAVLGFNDLELE